MYHFPFMKTGSEMGYISFFGDWIGYVSISFFPDMLIPCPDPSMTGGRLWPLPSQTTTEVRDISMSGQFVVQDLITLVILKRATVRMVVG